jgi:hypothetical protein
MDFKYANSYTNKSLRNLITKLQFDFNHLVKITQISSLQINNFISGKLELPYHTLQRIKNKVIDYLCDE